ncbi:MAG: chromosomal replication initiator protein DnaA [Eubacterium sp.]|jgi:chromosomal replication initiator protein|nr:chromosomal replication initiator protein DnaA [Eubacterium sp.]
MENKIKAQWSEIIAYLMEESDISKPAIRTFIEPLEFFSYDNRVITFQINKETQGDCISLLKSRYNVHIKVAIEVVIGEEIEISYIYKSESVSSYIKEETLTDKYPYLKSGHSFDTFVTSRSNSMAHAAAVAVAEAPTSQVYNPLFLYSGPGLGKTHLMHSIARHIIEHHSELNVLYTTSEDFTNQVIEAIRTNKKKGDTAATANLRKKYRNIDVFLIDDIQFIIGKESTQIEFFNTFEALFQSNKQIVISSDKPPRDMDQLDERYRSRFNSGLPIDIQPPDYETSMAILKNYQENESVKLDDKILSYIATNIRSNIRDLEGAYKRVIFSSKLHRKEITLDLAEDALKDIIRPDDAREITVDFINKIVTDHFNLAEDAIVSKRKQKSIAFPRQICMYLSKEFTDLSTTDIGEKLGNRDHSTIIHGCDKISEMLKVDKSLQNTIDILRKKINP